MTKKNLIKLIEAYPENIFISQLLKKFIINFISELWDKAYDEYAYSASKIAYNTGLSTESVEIIAGNEEEIYSAVSTTEKLFSLQSILENKDLLELLDPEDVKELQHLSEQEIDYIEIDYDPYD